MSWILDLMIVAIIVVSAIVTAKRGFVKTVLNIAALIISLTLVTSYGGALSDAAFDLVVKKPVQSSVEKSINDNFGAIADNSYTADELTQKLPQFLQKQLSKYGFDSTKLNGIVALKKTSAETAEAITVDIVKPMVTPLLLVIVDTLLFACSFIILKIAVRFICTLFKAPVLNKVNKLFGILLGLVKGILISVIVCTVIGFIVKNNISGEFLIFTQKAIDDSILFSMLQLF